MSLENKTSLVTGGSRGIGKAIVLKLQEEGSRVLAPNRNEMDLASTQSIDKYLSELKQPIDIIVNCAGILTVGSCEKLSSKDFLDIMQVNLIAPFRIISGLVNGMKQRNYGRIVNISSIWGLVSKEGRSIYSASKSGLNGLTKSLALELAPYGILVNAVTPGYVNTELILQNNSAMELEKIKKTIPLQRFAEPREIAEFVSFLCSQRNSYITGQVLPIDGGYLCK